MRAFHWRELFLYLYLVFSIFASYKWGRPILRRIKVYSFSLAECLIPSWLVLIHCFSRVIFGRTLLAFIILLTAFGVGLLWYDEARRHRRFRPLRFWKKVSRLIFLCLSLFLFSFVLLRLVNYMGW